MALTKLSSNEIQQGAITTDLISGDVALSMRIANVSIANSTYTVLDDTAVNVGGGYIVVTGAGFQSGCQVIVDETPATSTTFISSTELRAQIGAKSAATYDLFVVNPDGGAAIRVNGITYSATPTWVTASTLDNQALDVAFSVAFDATGATSYANTTVLPAGTQLLSNGYFYGTITGITEETTYNFTVSAIDAENQDSPREFSVTVTVGPSYQMWVWGYNIQGVLGLNTEGEIYSSPTQLGSDVTWDKIKTGVYASVAIKTDGTLWSWGKSLGLGLGDNIARSSPTQIGALTDWNLIDMNFYNTASIKTDGTLWTWGYNNNGQLGHNNRTIYYSPKQVGTDTNWSKISLGKFSGMSIKTDGTLWAWGQNGSEGQLGLNDTVNRSSPTQVGTLTSWKNVSAGERNTIATRTNNTLWTWGWNYYGQLGRNNTFDISSPVQVGTLTSWNLVKAGYYSHIATRTNGTLWSWGINNLGQLGLGNTVYKSSPTQVGSLTDWNLIELGRYSTMTTKTNGTLWMWGRGNSGELGINSSITISSPTQVGSDTNWTNISISQTTSPSVIATKTV